jgi:hypothetical protein
LSRVLLGCAVASLLIGAVLIYYYVSFSRIIDALHGERERSLRARLRASAGSAPRRR